MKTFTFEIYYKGRYLDTVSIVAENQDNAWQEASQRVTDDTEINLTEEELK